MTPSRSLLAAAFAVCLLPAYAVPASAIPFSSGSFAFSGSTSTTSNVNTTSIFALAGGTISPGSTAGDFASIVMPGTLSLVDPIDFTIFSDFDFTDAGLGSFLASSVSKISNTVGAPAWNIIGTFTVGTDFTNVGDVLSANEIWSLTQSGGPGNVISLSGTFHSPAIPTNLPEPATLLMFVAGLGAAGAAGRRKRQTS